MQVLVLGGGGREHALCWTIAKSPLLTKLWCAPGNAGIAHSAECVALDPCDAGAVVEFCRARKVDLLVIGPEAPLEAGVSDAARESGFKVFGPSRAAAQLETSKTFTKEFATLAAPRRASWARFEDVEAARAHIREQGAPIVLKADGLAAGKGVVVAESVEHALEAVEHIFDGPGGAAVVIEEFMRGEEASFFVLTDGDTVLPPGWRARSQARLRRRRRPQHRRMGAYSLRRPSRTPWRGARSTISCVPSSRRCVRAERPIAAFSTPD